VDERIVIVLRYEADLTVPSIANLTGVPEGTVKSRLHHALRKLRRSLEDAGR
jgi:RNA polymerase sigma-70 factor (ECF subfamily)